jgi:lipopolysaccharide biosynthesis protein
MSTSARFIAFYLPQFHPIPENDAWWGKGFTEWTNTAKALPLFRGHYQPHVPAHLGFYDLRVPETRGAQAQMASQYGVEAFCYYHYWFAGKQLLERPFNEVLASREPDYPFCLCWANQTWTGIWHGNPNRILMQQTYSGLDDHRAHFYWLLRAFGDSRYLTVDGAPLFCVFRPREIPDILRVTDFWRELAVDAGLKGLHLVGIHEDPEWQPSMFGFDASITPRLPQLRRWVPARHLIKRLRQEYEVRRGWPTIYLHEEVLDELGCTSESLPHNYPCIIPNWDNTPRSGMNGLVLHKSTPDLFKTSVTKALDAVRGRPDEHRLIFIKAWNEWAEGNHLEPDLRFGDGYLRVIADAVTPAQSAETPRALRRGA